MGAGCWGGIGGRGVAVGGGLGIIGLIIALLLGFNPTSGGGGVPAPNAPGGAVGRSPADGLAGSGTGLAQECRTGADANRREDCRVVGVVNSVQKFWSDDFARRGRRYVPARTVFFTSQVDTGCGPATSQVGPFYCPADKHVYIDLGFFQELRSKFGARGGPFAEAYVVAHEYGHHVQDLVGTSRRGGATGRGPRAARGSSYRRTAMRVSGRTGLSAPATSGG